MSAKGDGTPASQEAAFAAEWHARNGHLKNPEPEPPREPPPPRTKGEKLLAAARKCEQPFEFRHLVIGAWLAYGSDFGLGGSQNYPCSHTVAGLFYGRRGLLGRGLIERAGTGLFRVKGGNNGRSNA